MELGDQLLASPASFSASVSCKKQQKQQHRQAITPCQPQLGQTGEQPLPSKVWPAAGVTSKLQCISQLQGTTCTEQQRWQTGDQQPQAVLVSCHNWSQYK
jgi:hypothetical protein